MTATRTARKTPAPRTTESKRSAPKKAAAAPVTPDTVALDSLATTIAALRRVKARADKLDVERTRLEREIKAALGETERGTVDGVDVIHWTRTKRATVSVKLLKEKHPDVAEACTVTQEIRSLRLVEPA